MSIVSPWWIIDRERLRVVVVVVGCGEVSATVNV
jgi:hypothetical protein